MNEVFESSRAVGEPRGCGRYPRELRDCPVKKNIVDMTYNRIDIESYLWQYGSIQEVALLLLKQTNCETEWDRV